MSTLITLEFSRRKLFGFGAALLAAPAIVKISAIMPVSTMPMRLTGLHPYTLGLIEAMQETWINVAARVLNEEFEVKRYLTGSSSWYYDGTTDQVWRS